jgi:hypothetical protein
VRLAVDFALASALTGPESCGGCIIKIATD